MPANAARVVNTSEMTAPDRVLLVGIDRYCPAREPGDSSYPCLAGAVRDVRGVERFLGDLAVSPERIERLVAPGAGPLPPAAHLPTYENLVAALERLWRRALPGEQVLVFYAGHGGRVTTSFPELKGDDGLDEALVPWNIGDPEARYLRDVELAYLVRRIVDRGVHLTLVLDCCHSGSALRRDGPGPAAAFRELGHVDLRPPAAVSLAGSREELLANWRRHCDQRASAPSGWLPSPRGYVLLAACEGHEKALEYAFDGEHREGVFSRALLDALEPRRRISYRELHEQVFAAVQAAFGAQTPQLEGDADRYLFESLRSSRRRGVAVLRVDCGAGRMLLQAGEAQGVRPGTRFEIEPAGLVVEVSRSGSSLSWASAIGDWPAGGLPPAAQAHLTALSRPAAVRLRGPAAATAAVAAALVRKTAGFAVLSSPPAEADLVVACDSRGGLEIRDARGERLPNQGRPLRLDERLWAQQLRERLVHLARYRAVQSIAAPPAGALLSGKLRVRLCHGSAENPEDGPAALASPAGELSVGPGESLRFELGNAGRQPLFLTILDLRPDWSVVQVYPGPELGRAGLPLEPGPPLSWTLHRHLFPDVEPGAEEIQVFATVGAAEFRWLELPPLDPLLDASSPQRPAAGLTPPLRALEPEAAADRGWTMWRLKLRPGGEQTSGRRVGRE
jgi:hypothetical protein